MLFNQIKYIYDIYIYIPRTHLPLISVSPSKTSETQEGIPEQHLQVLGILEVK